MRDLLADYHARRPELMALYGPAPEAAADVATPGASWNPDLVATVNAFQERLGARNRVVGNERVVVTGQQPGLLGGPLYTVHKALTAVKLARRIASSTGAPCVPLFWIAGDDHDFAEAGHVHLLTKRHAPLRLDYLPSHDVSSVPMHLLPVETSLHQVIDLAADNAFSSEFGPEIREFLHTSLDASSSFAEWTGRLLARLFANTPLVFFAPHLPEARRLARPVLDWAVREPLAAARMLNETGAHLHAMGYPPQIEKRPDECAFFLERDGRRRKVVFRGGHFVLPETREILLQDECLALLADQPEVFSPNVALRCLVQQQLFPAAAYVAGPGELAYWGQLKPLFEALRLPQPAVHPRARCFLLDEKTRRILDALGLCIEEVHGSVEEATLSALLRTAASPALDAVRAHRAGLEQGARELVATLRDAEPPATAVAERLARTMAARLDRLEWVIARGDEARRDAIRQRTARAINWIAPWRKPQERVYTVFSFLFQHGWPLVGRLSESLDIDSPERQEVIL